MHENQTKIIELAKRKDISKMSYREIARELGIANPQTVIYHIDQLKKNGQLLYTDSGMRPRIAKPKAFFSGDFFNIPIVGSANCGPATELAQEDISGYIKISENAIGRSKVDGLIAVKAVGHSLNKANVLGDSIEEGDYVIVDCRKQPKDRDYVLSVIDGAANFKKYFRDEERQEIRLVSESTYEIPPITIHEEDIQTSQYLVNGVVVRVIKNQIR
ncbi:MAG: S24 family peptidase [Candidatus Gracilibacteria bacterium]